MTTIAELVDKTKTYYCLDCGVCTGSCPVSKINPKFSPRQIIERSLYELEDASDETIWSCLTCSQCSVRCPANIDFPEFVREIRGEARKEGFNGTPSHNGMLQTITSIQALGGPQDRTFWIGDDLKTAEAGEILYFVGCRPYHDVVFRDIDAGSLDAPKNVVRLLNAAGVTPVVSNEERCCGHDTLWNGDKEKFQKLATLNMEMIKKSGAKKVLFSCPEGYHTVKEVYPEFFGELPFEPVHILDFLSEKIDEGALQFNECDLTVTYHDPCRLGRLSGIFDAPRKLMEAVPGLTLNEMPRSRENGVCCGTSGWMNCSGCSKEIQLERLNEAKDTGASAVITACPKCQIHFRCTKKAFDLEIGITDLLDLLAENLKA